MPAAAAARSRARRAWEGAKLVTTSTQTRTCRATTSRSRSTETRSLEADGTLVGGDRDEGRPERRHDPQDRLQEGLDRAPSAPRRGPRAPAPASACWAGDAARSRSAAVLARASVSVWRRWSRARSSSDSGRPFLSVAARAAPPPAAIPPTCCPNLVPSVLTPPGFGTRARTGRHAIRSTGSTLSQIRPPVPEEQLPRVAATASCARSRSAYTMASAPPARAR